MRTIVVGAVLLFVCLAAGPVAAADPPDDGGTPGDELILAARNEVAAFTSMLSGVKAAGPDLRAQADKTVEALGGATSVPALYPCPHDAAACREQAAAATTTTQLVSTDVDALAGPSADADPGTWPERTQQYTKDSTAFDSVWDDFRVAYREAMQDENAGLSALTVWLIIAAVIAASAALTVALRFWSRRAGAVDDRLVPARKAVYGAAVFLTFALIGVTAIVAVVDGFDATLGGRAGGKATIVVLLVPVAAISLLWSTGKYLVARKKVGRATAPVA